MELVDGVTRLCAMNLFLHGIGPDDDKRAPPIKTDDSLRNEPSEHVEARRRRLRRGGLLATVDEEGPEGSRKGREARKDVSSIVARLAVFARVVLTQQAHSPMQFPSQGIP